MSIMRLQRALAHAGIASRRGAEELIEAGVVKVDGAVAELGSKVDPDSQTITVRGKRVHLKATKWIVFHKPLGVVTTASDEEGRRTVYEFVPKRDGFRYVGRLDIMTTGLLLLTTDGEAIHRLTHPSYRVPRKYTALVHGPSTAEFEGLVKKRIVIDDRPVLPSDVRVRPGTGGRSIIDLMLIEGRNNIVRKWVKALGGKIERLARLSYGPIRLGDLPVGEWRPLKDAEIRDLYRLIKLPVP